MTTWRWPTRSTPDSRGRAPASSRRPHRRHRRRPMSTDFDDLAATVRAKPGETVDAVERRARGEGPGPRRHAERTARTGEEASASSASAPASTSTRVRRRSERRQEIRPSSAARHRWPRSPARQFFSPSGIANRLPPPDGDGRRAPTTRPSGPVRSSAPIEGGRLGRRPAGRLLVLLWRPSTSSSGCSTCIPLLPLDGGHVAIATYERIRSIRGAAATSRRRQADADHLRRARHASSSWRVRSTYLDIDPIPARDAAPRST